MLTAGNHTAFAGPSFIVALALASSAVASPMTAQLRYDLQPGISGCPEVAQIRDAVASRLGRPPFDDSSQLHIDVSVARQATALVGTLVVQRPDGSTGRRVITSAGGDCRELTASLELAISLVIDPQSLSAPTPPPLSAPPLTSVEPTPVATAPPLPPPPAPAPTPRPAPSQPPSSTSTLGLEGGVVGTMGAVPGATAGLLLGGWVKWARVSVALEGRAHWPTEVTFNGGSASVLLFEAALLPCLRLGPLGVCAMASAGALRVDGATSLVTSQTVPLVMLGGRVEVTLPFRDTWTFALFLEGRAVVTSVAISSGSSPLWATWPAAPSAGASLRWPFP